MNCPDYIEADKSICYGRLRYEDSCFYGKIAFWFGDHVLVNQDELYVGFEIYHHTPPAGQVFHVSDFKTYGTNYIGGMFYEVGFEGLTSLHLEFTIRYKDKKTAEEIIKIIESSVKKTEFLKRTDDKKLAFNLLIDDLINSFSIVNF